MILKIKNYYNKSLIKKPHTLNLDKKMVRTVEKG